MSAAQIFQRLLEESVASEQTLERRPEPFSVTNSSDSVEQYNRVLETNMTANLCSSLDLIHRVRPDVKGGRALDFCSGPGFISCALHTSLKYDNVLGVDLADRMVEIARVNAAETGDHVRFEVADILEFRAQTSFDLVSFTNAAHHLPTIADVRIALTSAESATRSSGVIVLTDIGRLKTESLTEGFVALAGSEFLDKAMPDMYDDFRNSMYAGWTAQELAQAVPLNTKRVWVQLYNDEINSFQALVGLPVGRTELYLRESYEWESSGLLRSEVAKEAWPLMKNMIQTAKVAVIKP